LLLEALLLEALLLEALLLEALLLEALLCWWEVNLICREEENLKLVYMDAAQKLCDVDEVWMEP
jgi:hypothetical protein